MWGKGLELCGKQGAGLEGVLEFGFLWILRRNGSSRCSRSSHWQCLEYLYHGIRRTALELSGHQRARLQRLLEFGFLWILRRNGSSRCSRSSHWQCLEYLYHGIRRTALELSGHQRARFQGLLAFGSLWIPGRNGSSRCSSSSQWQRVEYFHDGVWGTALELSGYERACLQRLSEFGFLWILRRNRLVRCSSGLTLGICV